MEILKGSINSINGIKAASKYIGIKKSKNDFLVIFSEKKANAAGVFTKNKVKGAPLIVSIANLKDGKAQAIVINSGVSNVATGKKGLDDAYKTAEIASKELGIDKNDILVASTGIIGKFLPMDKIKNGLIGIKKELTKNPDKICESIMTTDLNVKELFIKEGNFSIGAIAKGSGMIHPNMATMLCFIATDAEIESNKLKICLKKSVEKSFNMISVDNDTSTSDSVMILANGLAGKVDLQKFQETLDFLCIKLAKMIARDGEGATKLIEVNVKNAKSQDDAKKIAKSIVSSNLVKAAFFGNDLNWGRIMCAIGNSDASFKQDKVNINFNSEMVVKDGIENSFNKENAINALKKEEVKVTIDLNDGIFEATAWGCDLSYEYIKINAEYST